MQGFNLYLSYVNEIQMLYNLCCFSFATDYLDSIANIIRKLNYNVSDTSHITSFHAESCKQYAFKTLIMHPIEKHLLGAMNYHLLAAIETETLLNRNEGKNALTQNRITHSDCSRRSSISVLMLT